MCLLFIDFRMIFIPIGQGGMSCPPKFRLGTAMAMSPMFDGGKQNRKDSSWAKDLRQPDTMPYYRPICIYIIAHYVVGGSIGRSL